MPFDSSFFDEVIERQGTDSEKWDGMPPEHAQGLLPMWVADMDFPSPPAVSEALIDRATHPVYGYTRIAPDDSSAFNDFWLRRHGLNLPNEWTVMIPCVVSGLRLAVQALTQPGDGIIIQTPVYGPFLAAASSAGRIRMDNPLIEEDGYYRMDYEGLERQMCGGGKLLMLCNPHNPVGRAFGREELERVLALAKQYGVNVVSDEIHADFVYAPGKHVPMVSLPGAEERVLALCSASKTFNIAGLQQATLIAPNPELRARFVQQIQDNGVVAGNLMALVATRAAYQQGDPWLDGLMAYLKESRRIVYDFIEAELPKLRISPLEATYLAWLDCRALGKTEAELLQLCREKGKVELTPGGFFGQEGEGFLRLNIGCPHAQLRDALGRLKTALGDL